MKGLRFLVVSVLLLKSAGAQLLPSIGISTQPANSATLCEPPYYTGSFYTSGYQVGNQVPDFKLYNLQGDSLILSQVLQSGKPALLIAGSLTCPVFRAKVPIINSVMATYGTSVNVFVIYTIEAHPTDTSVYSGNVNVTNQNINDGVLFPSPLTYGQRKDMVDTMPTWVSLNAPVFIDGPCNEWWNSFGPAPNNSYLIAPSGTVVSKHGWFHKLPADNIFCDIDAYLSTTSGSCVTTTSPGHFSVNVLNNISFGSPGATLYDFAQVINTQSVPVTVSAQKIQENIPTLWETSFCADVCYGPLDTYVSFVVNPFDTLLFSLDYATHPSAPDSGRVKVGFQNVNNSSNSYVHWLKASTYPNTGISENDPKPSLVFHPNPFSGTLKILGAENECEVEVFNTIGQCVFNKCNITEINATDWPSGIYTIHYRSNNYNLTRKVILR